MPDKELTPAEIEQNRYMLRHLKQWLRYRGMKQRGLADRLDMSEPQVSKWLRGLVTMTTAQFVEIARILEAKPEELLFSPDERGTASNYKEAAAIVQNLSKEELAHWIAVGQAMQKKTTEKQDKAS